MRVGLSKISWHIAQYKYLDTLDKLMNFLFDLLFLFVSVLDIYILFKFK